MATTIGREPGRTRIKLAEKLNQFFAGKYRFDPDDLQSQIPVYASPQWDCCSWYAFGQGVAYPSLKPHVASWHKMGEFLERNTTIHIVDHDGHYYEIMPVKGE